MTDLRTASPDELPELGEIPADLRAVVFSPSGPLQSVPHERLLAKLIATNLCKATKATLDADLGHDADSVALVFGDPVATANGWYRKLGASGAGSWDQFEELARNARVLAEAAAEAAAEELSAFNDASASALALISEEADRAEAAAAGIQSQRWVLPAYSAQFPNLNRQFAGLAGHIAYPNNNLNAGGDLLRNDAPGAFFMLHQVPHERTKRNRGYTIMGNSGFATSPGTWSFVHYGDDFNDTTLHDRLGFRFRANGGGGSLVSLVTDVQTRADAWQLTVVTANGAGNISMASFAAAMPKIAGTSQAVTAGTRINTLTGTHLLVGDAASTPGTLTPLAEASGAYGGAIAFHGFVRGTAGTDAQWQAIAEGADIIATLTGATGYSLFRDYRSGGADLEDRLAAFAPGDTTLEGAIHGTVQPGGTAGRQSAAQWLTVQRLPDGYVINPADNAINGFVRLNAASNGVSGDLICRVLSTLGDVLVAPFRVAPISAMMNFRLPVPYYQGWGLLEFWPSNNPSCVYRMNSRVGCGDKPNPTGQSQTTIAMSSRGAPVIPTGLHSICQFQGSRADPGDTLTSPVPRVSLTQRPQIYVVEPQMTNVHTGAAGLAARILEHNGGRAICIVDDSSPGTGALDWINNSLSGRLWTVSVELRAVSGRDLTGVWNWYTNDASSYPGAFDAVVKGMGASRSDQFLGDGTAQASGYRMGVCLPNRATGTTAGPFDVDNFGTNRTNAQAGQIAFAVANPTLMAIGPATTDIFIDNAQAGSGGTAIAAGVANANLGGPHQSENLYEGSYRLGYRLGETYLRARGKSPSPLNPYLDGAAATINAGRTVITIPARLPNPFSRLQTDNNMFVINANPTAGETVTIDGHVVTFVASGATGQQVNIGGTEALTATALRDYIAANLSATHTVYVWNRHVTVQRVERGRRPVLAEASAGIILPGATIEGFIVGGSRSGFTPAIVGNEFITLTKTSGSWAAPVTVSAYAGGPFSYGTSDELNARWKGHLYDGCEADNGLGWPLLGFGSVILP